MKSNYELKEIDIKNCTCYYFDDIMRVGDIDFNNISLDKKPYENILIYDISYKTFMGAKPLRIRFDKVYGVIKIFDGTRYLELFGPKIYNAIYDIRMQIRINYLISKKSDAKYIINHNFARIRMIHIIFYL